MLASVPINHAAELLQDESNVTWTAAQLLGWWNEAQRVIASLAPRSATVTEAVQLTANETRHTLASTRASLLVIHRNMGTDGLTPGRSVRLAGLRELEDAVGDTWHSMTGEAAVKSYVYDERVPTQFWVYPRVHATTAVYVEMTAAKVPTDAAAAGSNIDIGEQYEPAGVQWMMYRCLSRDSKRTPIFDRSLHYLQSFAALMAGEARGDILASPVMQRHLENLPAEA